MKKRVRIITALIVIAIVLLILGIALSFFTQNNFASSAFDLIMLIISVSSILIALIAHLSAERTRRISERIIRNIYDIDRAVGAESMLDRSLSYKLDKIIAQNEALYVQNGGKLEKIRKESSAFAREKRQERIEKAKKKKN